MQTTLRVVERDAIFRRLDFRSKLCLAVVVTGAALLWENPAMQAGLALLTLLLCLWAGLAAGYIRSVVLVLLPFAAFMLLMHGFLSEALLATRLGGSELTPLLTLPASWWGVGGARLSLEGVLYAVNVICKTLTMALITPLALFTGDPNAMLLSLIGAGVPYKIAFVFSSALRFFPLLFGEIQNIIVAQQLRGLPLEKMGPVRKVRVYARIAVPLILGALVKAQALDIALQSRAFSGSAERTYLHEARLGAGDYWLLGVCALFLAGVLVTYWGWGIGRF
ncbi:MAG: energy-coupling factor transporter transmembrane protein EcfT [Anaerolineae bacterium]|nr:energy-coupling factor transporter transmembrane protein EcfT [Anaerolineae bacterium]